MAVKDDGKSSSCLEDQSLVGHKALKTSNPAVSSFALSSSCQYVFPPSLVCFASLQFLHLSSCIPLSLSCICLLSFQPCSFSISSVSSPDTLRTSVPARSVFLHHHIKWLMFIMWIIIARPVTCGRADLWTCYNSRV